MSCFLAIVKSSNTEYFVGMTAIYYAMFGFPTIAIQPSKTISGIFLYFILTWLEVLVCLHLLLGKDIKESANETTVNPSMGPRPGIRGLVDGLTWKNGQFE